MNMPKFTIQYETADKEKVEKYLKSTVMKMKIALAMYMKVDYSKVEGKNEFTFSFDYRSPLKLLISKGGNATANAMQGMTIDAMHKLNDRFKKDKIKASVINVA